MRKDCKEIVTRAASKRGRRPRVRDLRMAAADLRAALAKGEADIAAGRITTLDSAEGIKAFFSRL
jgi:hypothetical protein